MTANRLVVAAIAVLALVAAADAVRSDGEVSGAARFADTDFRIDLGSSRDGTWLPTEQLRDAFPGARPETLAVSKVAVAPDDVTAIGVSSVSGRSRARAAIELWEGDRNVGAFAVPAGSFARGLWFAGDGRAIATIGWNGRGYLYDRDGRPLSATAYFAYETP